MMDAGLQTYRRSMLLHELATTCRLVVVLDDPDPSSRDAAFLSMWQLDGKSEPAQPVHANGGELSLRSSIAALAQLTDTCEASVATVRAELAVEEQEDAAMRGKYGDRWEIVASDAMTQDAQAELHLCEDRLLLAAGANQQVAASFAESRDAISPLELTLEELLARVPHSGGSP